MMSFAYVTRSLFHSAFCGDQAQVWQHDRHVHLCLVDGLGHGSAAEEAALMALDTVSENLEASFEHVFRVCDEALRNSRGCAMALAFIDGKNAVFSYAAVGNIYGTIHSRRVIRLICGRGIVGAGYNSLFLQEHQLKERDVIILQTDGVAKYDDLPPAILTAEPEEIAGWVMKKYATGTDDAGVLVYKHGYE